MTHPSIIDVQSLSERLGAPDLVILDCRYDLAAPDTGQAEFQQGHIPGAHYASLHRDLSGPLSRFGGRHPLPSADAFRTFACRAGVNRESTVVVYDDQRLAFAARAWWLLRYFGHRAVKILNGGYSAWRAAALACEAGSARPVAPGDFIPTGDEATLDYDAVFSALPHPPWQLVDARESRRYAGLEEPIDPIAGHIPTAINKPWQEVTNEQGFIRPRDEQSLRWEDTRADRKLVNYCGSGVTACVNLFSLHLIGRDDAALYPGSWSDWCAHLLYPEGASSEASQS